MTGLLIRARCPPRCLGFLGSRSKLATLHITKRHAQRRAFRHRWSTVPRGLNTPHEVQFSGQRPTPAKCTLIEFCQLLRPGQFIAPAQRTTICGCQQHRSQVLPPTAQGQPNKARPMSSPHTHGSPQALAALFGMTLCRPHRAGKPTCALTPVACLAAMTGVWHWGAFSRQPASQRR